MTKVPKRGILKQSTSFEQRGEEKYVEHKHNHSLNTDTPLFLKVFEGTSF